MGSLRLVSIITGAPMAICKALAPIILAFSYRVYFFFKRSPQKRGMGLLRFELRFQRVSHIRCPERWRMDQATLQPLVVLTENVNHLNMR